jgi:hypothetical protein
VIHQVACASGVLILAAATFTNILAGGGYAMPQAMLTLAVAVGAGTGAFVAGRAWADQRKALAGFLVAALVAGEVYGFLSTAERLVVGRETTQAPVRAHTEERVKVEGRLARAISAHAGLSATSPRLQQAVAAKASTDAAILSKSAERGCVENCRKLLLAQADAANQAIEAAHAEIHKQKKNAEAELLAAPVALAGLPAPASATPLADRPGLPAWALDLLLSAVGSVAALRPSDVWRPSPAYERPQQCCGAGTSGTRSRRHRTRSGLCCALPQALA